LKANKVHLFVSSVLFVFWYHSPNVLNTPHICNISWPRVKERVELYLYSPFGPSWPVIGRALPLTSYFYASARNYIPRIAVFSETDISLLAVRRPNFDNVHEKDEWKFGCEREVTGKMKQFPKGTLVILDVYTAI
jgi:hypothetical protein